ncbi:gamma-glutamyltransferase 2 [Syntrophobotulus glycolicus DSM 8271]|uniref:Gamma-glutamyltransferase 2 n=1 Tax=Syntrophobotulus glycolicus (strain DSM 8271 / FlGlyR) TaxID=645991 RepID=F0SU55_SYNGF|nr:gamma-glutamyltransferase family protein [Syntrophobotulus glycolicus]ADY55438.1 gamma-glutamyltransferase 2 [Syntrophobotulus glycolicus DSM 8271]
MNYDPLAYPYASRRSLVYGAKGMVATSQPLAAQAGLDMLKQGGNAVDAAVAAAACLAVVEPSGNGIGSDAFAIVHMDKKMYGLNSSGPAPRSLTIEALKKAGYDRIPKFGLIPVTVPGAPAAWAALSRRFGRLPFPQLLKPAIEYAEQGFAVSPVISRLWQNSFDLYQAQTDPAIRPWFDLFAPQGRPPQAGEIWRSPEQAASLALIAETEGQALYGGVLAEKISAFAREHGGFLTVEDLAAFQPEWVQPLSVNYRGYDVWELPPNGQGLVVLLALNLLQGFDFTGRESLTACHRQIEAVKLAFADALAHITDPKMMHINIETLLSEAYTVERRKQITKTAQIPGSGRPHNGGTVYLASADGEGNMVSFIQSNFHGFGSGVVIPGTGISLQNRGYNFSADPGHVNCLAPGKRTYHTIIPGFITKDGRPVGPFGVMGGYIQPQAQVQVLMNILDFGLNPQAALDAPRWQWLEGNKVEVEASFPDSLAEELLQSGHQIVRGPAGATTFGRGQLIWRDDRGVLTGATEPRTDGTVAVW